MIIGRRLKPAHERARKTWEDWGGGRGSHATSPQSPLFCLHTHRNFPSRHSFAPFSLSERPEHVNGVTKELNRQLVVDWSNPASSALFLFVRFNFRKEIKSCFSRIALGNSVFTNIREVHFYRVLKISRVLI